MSRLDTPDSFHAEAKYQGRCQHPNCKRPLSKRWHAHHVVYEQIVMRHRPELKYDPRNAMRLCNPKCHLDLQHGQQDPVPMSVVRDETIEFAVEVIGEGQTINFFQRHYGGAEEDPRLIELERIWEAA